MTTATLTREKKKRGLSSLINQFAVIPGGEQQIKLNPASENLTNKLNRMIGVGASFDVGVDSFQVFSSGGIGDADKQFLTFKKPFVLCVLQQALLMKYLPLDLIPDYCFEVKERIAILSGGGGPSGELYFEIVRDVTKEWFVDLLDEMSNSESNSIN